MLPRMIRTIEDIPAGGGNDLVTQVEQIFSPKGILSRSKNFEFRPQQQAMAMAVARALEHNSHLAVEAGTGVGKSLAYLVPAILHAIAKKRKAVISTHTINLQEQLTGKDLPMLKMVLPGKFEFTMLKGRANYLCTRRLHKARLQAGNLFTKSETDELERILEWSKKTEDGSLSDFESEPDPKVWGLVCSERGLCSPKTCGTQSEFAKVHIPCFFQRARSRILSADVLVLNHTLFFTLLGTLEEEVKGGILFRDDFVIFDEAHTMEAVASKHIGLSVSSGQVRYNLQRLWNPRNDKGLLATVRQGKTAKIVSSLLEEAEKFFAGVEESCDELAANNPSPSRGSNSQRRREWKELRIRQPGLAPDQLGHDIQGLRESVSDIISSLNDAEIGMELAECNRRLAELQEALRVFLGQEAKQHVYWVERGGRAQKAISLHAAPIDVAAFLRERLFSAGSSIVMTSATLATRLDSSSAASSGKEADSSYEPPAEDDSGEPRASKVAGRRGGPMQYFASRIGAEEAAMLQVGTPFDYQRQMKLFVVRKMPDPREDGYRDALVHWIEHFIRMTHGKAFVLFTSYKLMMEVSEIMEPFFRDLGLACFVQGTGTPRSLMLEKFKDDVDSVLFGTESFWQGVDVPGEALSNVIITRLPFAVPDHPLIEARLEAIETRGGDSFREFSLPEAILKFRQGVGRLIRTKSDTGIVVVLDNRILTKRYGSSFIHALPECPVGTL